MAAFTKRILLGTGLKVGPLGLAASYGAPGDSVPAPSDCYRFVLSNPAVDVCLCGPKTIDQMRAALPALELGPLGEKDMERMKRIGDYVHGHTRRF